MIDVVRGFLSLLRAPPETDAARLKKLAEVLDQLGCAYHGLPDKKAEYADYAAEPDLTSYDDMRKTAARAFPDFGFYAVVPPDMNPEPPPQMGDAIDDLADIALELELVQWLWDNASPQDAEDHFRFGYQCHWGRHLHDLRSYVHAQRFEN